MTDDLLAPFARLLGRMLGKAPYCGTSDCPLSEFGWPEYALVGLALVAAFLAARALMTRRGRRP